ncbi:MAG: S8 family peptidase [Actinomycetota bacterium]
MNAARIPLPGGRMALLPLLALIAALLTAAPGAAAPVPVLPELEAQLAEAPADASLTVLVTGATTEQALTAVDSAGLARVEVFDRFGIVAAAGTPAAVRALHGKPGVLRVDANLGLEPLDDLAHRATGVAPLRNPENHPELGDLRRADGTPYDGTGISIAIIDEGFEATHEQFVRDGLTKVDVHLRQACPIYREFIVYGTGTDPSPDCSAWVPPPSADGASEDDVYGHGTIVAATAAGYPRTTPHGKHVSGVAPGARLVALSIGAGGTDYNAVSAFNWVLDHHADPCGDESCPPIRVVNSSWGLASDDDLFVRRFDPGTPINRLTTALVQDGVVVLFAAGNDGGDGSRATTNYFGLNPIPGFLLVGGYHDANAGDRDFMVWGGSARGKKGDRGTYPDVLAPGVDVTIGCAEGSYLCSAGPGLDGHYGTFSGTSLSAPYVSGVVAQMLEADPSLTPGQIEDVLEDTAYQLGPPGNYEPDVYVDWAGNTRGNSDHSTSFDAGHGNVDVVGALSRVLTGALRRSPDPCPRESGVAWLDPAGDTRFLFQEVPFEQPGHDVVAVGASVAEVPGALSVVVTYNDLPDVAFTPMHTTVRAVIDFGDTRGPGGSVEVDLDRTPAGDGFSVFRGPVTVEGTVDPAADTALFIIRPTTGPIVERASVTFVWTSTRSDGFPADVDVTDGGCTVWVP